MARDDTEKWALPGTFLHEGETLAEAVERSLRDKAGVHGIRPRQLHVFDAPDRDDRGWVLSVAHVAVVRPDQLESPEAHSATEVRLVPVDRPGELVWDHSDIVRLAKQHIRSATCQDRTPTGCWETSSRCASYNWPTRTSPATNCRATSSAAGWNRT